MKDINVNPEAMFALADELLKSQADMINKQNELIKRLMERIDKLEQLTLTPSAGLKGLSL